MWICANFDETLVDECFILPEVMIKHKRGSESVID